MADTPMYDEHTTRIADAIRPMLEYEADLVDVFRDASGINVVLRTRDDDEIMLRVVE